MTAARGCRRRRVASLLLLAAAASAQGLDHAAAVQRAGDALAALDRAFAAADGDHRVAELFAPDHCRRALALLLQRRATLTGPGLDLVRSSRLLECVPRAGTWLAFAEVTYREPHDPQLSSVAEECAVLAAADAPPQQALHAVVDVDRRAVRALATRRGVLSCPPCNFSLRLGEDWLVAPQRAPAAGSCVDAIDAFHLAADLALEFAVTVLPAALPARDAAERVLAAMPEFQVRPAPAWRPQDSPPRPMPTGYDEASLEAATPGRRLWLHVVTHGRVCYTLALRGSDDAFAHHGDDARAALDGFRLQRADVREQDVVARATGHHAGDFTVTADRRVEFRGHGVSLPLPDGWSAVPEPGTHRLGAELRSDCGGARVRVRGLAVPRGFAHWNRLLADRCFARCGGSWLADAEDSGWCETDGREFRQATEQRDGTWRGLRLLLGEDMVLLVQWSCVADQQAAARDLLAAIAWR